MSDVYSLAESAAVLTRPIVPQGVAEADTDVGRLIVSERDTETGRPAKRERERERERERHNKDRKKAERKKEREN